MIAPEDGRGKAREDWAQQQVHTMVSRELPSGAPKLLEGRLFYVASIAGVDWAEAFCADYNAEVDALLARHGPPEWAPGLRRLEPGECVELLASAPIDGLGTLPREAQILGYRVIEQWAWAAREVPLLAHDPVRELLVIGRVIISNGEVWLDVVDLRGLEYMSHYELHGTLSA